MSARILVVDDNPLNIKLLAAKLMRDYYIVISAESGEKAIELTEKEKPDLILLDIMMPEMDGFETCKRIKANEKTSHIPIVMVTALSDVTDRVRGLEAGADDFLTKPINDMALMARVRSLLRLKMIMDEWRLREATASQLTLPNSLEKDEDGPARILLLEDSPHDRDRIVNTIRKLTGSTATAVENMDDAVQETKLGDYDLAIVSLDLQSGDSLFFCSQLRADEATRSLPILLIANENEIDRVAKGLDLGANDYVLRPLESSELLARARTQLRQKRHHDWLRKNYEQNMSLALVDPLTGAYNRRYLDVHLPRMFAKYRSDNRPIAVLMLDIDFFKKINDTYGHPSGDVVLKAIVARITQSVRPHDLVARTGGEEFSVIMPEADMQTAINVGERMREKISATPIPINDNDPGITVTISIGVAVTRYDKEDSIDSAFLRADTALYRAKQTGRNRVESDAGGD
ncbi:MAG: PleD family two-component system response regulator [Alphaproteobacteria bacterium]|nr:PleD family two-component system response regulator [Alphaproteobacteria bacterium]